MDIIFKLACFLLPFENFFFAPSSGWATIAPLILSMYVLMNFKLAFNSIYKYRKIFTFFSIGIIFTLATYLFTSYTIANFISALISLGLGLVCLLSFDIYFIQRKNNIENIVKVLLYSYYISLIIGWIQYLVIRFNITKLIEIFNLIEKRSYIMYGRVQFTFTEPSFIGMHLFGILLPIYFYARDKKIIKLIILFSISSIIFGSGVRVLLDILIVTSILVLAKINFRNAKNIAILIFIPIVLFYSFNWIYNNNYRVRQIVDKGIYADGSLASRYFRINASIKGYRKSLDRLFIGYGMGNSLIPLKDGYFEAINEYKSSYLDEVIELGDPNFNNDSVSYCLYIRIISEFGIFMFMILIYYLISLCIRSRNKVCKIHLIIVLYLYLQFESYAFYAIWIYIVFTYNNRFLMENKVNEYIEG